MASNETSGQKTEEPTPQLLRKARQQGDVPLSRDLSSAAVLAAAALSLGYVFASLVDAIKGVAHESFAHATSDSVTSESLLTLLGGSVMRIALAMSPILAVVLAVAFVAPFLQVGPLLTAEALKPKLDHLNPMTGIKNRFFSLSAYVELIKAVLKMTAVAVLCAEFIYSHFRDIALSSSASPELIAAVAGYVLTQCVVRVVVLFMAIGTLDFVFQRWNYQKQHRISKEEKKRSYKEQEGDPEHKSKRRRLHREVNANAVISRTAAADAVVTNPHHLACALRYDPDEEQAPRLIAKGRGAIAKRIREIADEAHVPLVRNIPLAHALYELEPEDLIPEDLYDAVAEVLDWVETMSRARGELPRWAEAVQD